VTPQVRLVAAGLAPAFFTTVTVGGDQLRRVRRAAAGGDRRGDRHSLARAELCKIATLLNVGSVLARLGIRSWGAVALTGVLLAVVLGWLVAQTALVPLNALTATVEDLAETTDVTRRLSPGGPTSLGGCAGPSTACSRLSNSRGGAQSQLVVDASHELRTPLTSLRTNLEVIKTGR